MHLICFRFCLLCSILESVRQCLWGIQLHIAIHLSRNLEVALCWLVLMPGAPVWRFQCWGVNLWTDSYLWKPKTQLTSLRLGWSLAMVILYFHSSSHVASIRTELDHEDGCWKTLCLTTGLCAMLQMQENPVLALRKNCDCINLLILGCLYPCW